MSTRTAQRVKAWLKDSGNLWGLYNVAAFTVASVAIYAFGDMLAL
jgi:hypothetical protein